MDFWQLVIKNNGDILKTADELGIGLDELVERRRDPDWDRRIRLVNELFLYKTLARLRASNDKNLMKHEFTLTPPADTLVDLDFDSPKFSFLAGG